MMDYLEEEIPTINPKVRQYLMDKYPEKFAQLTEQKQQAREGIDKAVTPGAFGHILSGLRGAMEGRSYEDVQGGVDKQAEGMKANVMRPYYEREKDLRNSFDVGKEAFGIDRDITKAGREDTEYASMDSTDSPQAKGYADLIKSMSPNFKTEGMTVRQMEPYVKILKEKYGIDESIAQRKDAARERNLDRAESRAAREEDRNYRRTIDRQKWEDEAPKRTFNNLPEEKKQTIEGLAKKNVNKVAIANQIESVINNWDALSDAEKVTQGRQLIKVLNSTEGADAVGAEEAKRLGGNLEFAWTGNLFNSNPLQAGRDLPGFKKQALDTAKAIKDAIKMNNTMIDEAYGRKPLPTDKSVKDLSDDELMKELYK